MIIKYDITKIKELLTDFHKLTGLTISIWDTDYNQLAFCPSPMQAFCKLIKSSPLGKKRCLLSDIEICSDCKQTRRPATHQCHAGLVDTAIPIMYDETIMGFVIFGQIRDKHFPLNTHREILKLSTELNLPYDKLSEAYRRLERFDVDVIHAAANILKSALPYLCMNNSIKFTENELVNAIDDYIDDHICSHISVTTLCNKFLINKNKLYALWNKWFGVTPGEYIMSKRMKTAKNLLTTTDYKISRICVMAGIPDYNYFSKVFKKYYGVPPREYRKRFPIILESRQ